MYRSKWTGLTTAEAHELDQAQRRAKITAEDDEEASWSVHVDYSRRAAALLAGNDLRGALQAAEIAAAALRAFEAERSRNVQRELQAVVREYPHAGKPARIAKPAKARA